MRSSMARLAMRSPASRITPPASTSGSPTRIPRPLTSASDVAPTSTHRSFTLLALERSSCWSRWIGFFPTTPGTSPSRARTVTRWPTTTCASQPPISSTKRKPLASMWVIWSPISSMWPASITRGEPSGLTSAKELPLTSTLTRSAKVSASARHTRAGRTSNPEGPAASSRRSRKSICMRGLAESGRGAVSGGSAGEPGSRGAGEPGSRGAGEPGSRGAGRGKYRELRSPPPPIGSHRSLSGSGTRISLLGSSLG